MSDNDYFTFTLLLLYVTLFYFTLLYLSNYMIMYACLSVYGKDSDQF